jgi:hypothetical protein
LILIAAAPVGRDIVETMPILNLCKRTARKPATSVKVILAVSNFALAQVHLNKINQDLY